MEPQGTIDSLLRMYRETIQTNDYRQAVQTLRNLDKADPSQNWKGNLAQAEKAFQVQLESAFEDALGKNDAQTAANLAREYLAEPWLITPIGNTATAMRAYIVGFDAAKETQSASTLTGLENISTLFVGACLLISLICIIKYPVNKSKYARLQAANERRRGGEADFVDPELEEML